jgi:beta-galactosidase GanA
MNPSRDVFDLDLWRAYQPLLDACMKLGLWVIARPGPYINAEVSLPPQSHRVVVWSSRAALPHRLAEVEYLAG